MTSTLDLAEIADYKCPDTRSVVDRRAALDST